MSRRLQRLELEPDGTPVPGGNHEKAATFLAAMKDENARDISGRLRFAVSQFYGSVQALQRIANEYRKPAPKDVAKEFDEASTLLSDVFLTTVTAEVELRSGETHICDEGREILRAMWQACMRIPASKRKTVLMIMSGFAAISEEESDASRRSCMAR